MPLPTVPLRLVRLARSTLVVAVLGATDEAHATRHACEPVGLRIERATAAETTVLCDAWQRTLEALAPLGIGPRPVTVEVGPPVPRDGAFAAVFGFFDPVGDVVGMRSLDDYLASDDGGFGEPPSVGLWRSFIVHELTHALVHPHLSATEGRRITHEFVAYATQLATLDAATLSRILERYATTAYRDETAINEIVYAMAPHRFGVRAYLTVAASPEPKAYVWQRLRHGFASSTPW